MFLGHTRVQNIPTAFTLSAGLMSQHKTWPHTYNANVLILPSLFVFVFQFSNVIAAKHNVFQGDFMQKTNAKQFIILQMKIIAGKFWKKPCFSSAENFRLEPRFTFY